VELWPNFLNQNLSKSTSKHNFLWLYEVQKDLQAVSTGGGIYF
jgi:hypothetical protein